MSKEININQKLFDLQQEIGTISKDASNPFYKSKYFDINSLIGQLNPYLKKYKLLLHQPTDIDFETGIEFVCTFFECIETKQRSTPSRLKLKDEKDPQKLGSQITYFRRYTLASLLGLQAVDDDGNAASGIKVEQDKLPWLNANTPAHSRAIEHMKKGGDIKAIEAKFQVSTKMRNELQNAAKL